jgi:hypothetical protein
MLGGSRTIGMTRGSDGAGGGAAEPLGGVSLTTSTTGTTG